MVHEEVLHKLRKVPWISLKFQEKVYFIKKDFKENEYFLLATDLTNIWARYSGERDISSEKEDYNPQLEAATASLMVILSKQFESQRPEVKYKYLLQQTEMEETPPLLLKIRTKFGTFPFRWTFCCDPVGSAEEQSKTIADYFVYPLMVVNSYLLSLASHFDASTVDQEALVRVFALSPQRGEATYFREPVFPCGGLAKPVFEAFMNFTQSAEDSKRKATELEL